MSDFVALILECYGKLAASEPAMRELPARSDPQKAFAFLLAARSRNLRGALEQFKDTHAVVEGLASSVDLETVYRTLSMAVVLADDVGAHDALWLRNRDASVERLQRETRRLRHLFARRQLDHEAALLESELCRLATCGGSLEDRAELTPTKGGRPRALWREGTRKRLHDAGVPYDQVSRLLVAAGLTDKYRKS